MFSKKTFFCLKSYKYSSIFFSKAFRILVLSSGLCLSQIKFVHGEERVKILFLFFSYIYTDFPVLFVEKTFLSPLICFEFLFKTYSPDMHGSFFEHSILFY